MFRPRKNCTRMRVPASTSLRLAGAVVQLLCGSRRHCNNKVRFPTGKQRTVQYLEVNPALDCLVQLQQTLDNRAVAFSSRHKL
jgi:hypothetical protein